VKKLHRVDIRTLPDAMLDDPAVVIVSRLVITGGNHHRLHEELTVSGGYLKDGGFSREPRVTQVNEWLTTASESDATQAELDKLSARFPKYEEAIMQTVIARSRDRLRNLETTLQTRKQQEIKNIGTVLDELSKAITLELKKDVEPQQLALFSEDERLQVRRDSDALRARLARIPQEKDEEVDAIEQRYEGFVDRTFPVAVIFLMPESKMTRAGS